MIKAKDYALGGILLATLKGICMHHGRGSMSGITASTNKPLMTGFGRATLEPGREL